MPFHFLNSLGLVLFLFFSGQPLSCAIKYTARTRRIGYCYLVHITREDSIICALCILPLPPTRKTGQKKRRTKKQTDIGRQEADK